MQLDESQGFRCPGVIRKTGDRRYGERCGRLLAKANSQGKLEGVIKCKCGIVIEFLSGQYRIIEKQVSRITNKEIPSCHTE